ncbi:unnamed protein product [Arabis nemorensis]|uniref:Uncharacterized protein n=1 Tax=Arabis nemorensis TaxID=586526 RepID=A0A565CCD2_9BRAS|nr:unnamed protein product [Arabis nemorensis]
MRQYNLWSFWLTSTAHRSTTHITSQDPSTIHHHLATFDSSAHIPYRSCSFTSHVVFSVNIAEDLLLIVLLRSLFSSGFHHSSITKPWEAQKPTAVATPFLNPRSPPTLVSTACYWIESGRDLGRDLHQPDLLSCPLLLSTSKVSCRSIGFSKINLIQSSDGIKPTPPTTFSDEVCLIDAWFSSKMLLTLHISYQPLHLQPPKDQIFRRRCTTS